MSGGFTEKDFDAMLQSVLVTDQTNTRAVPVGDPSAPFDIKEFLTSIVKDMQGSSNVQHTPENVTPAKTNNNKNNNNSINSFYVQCSQTKEGESISKGSPKRARYDSFENMLHKVLKKHEDSPKKRKIEEEGAEFDDDFTEFILTLTGAKENTSSSNPASKSTSTDPYEINVLTAIADNNAKKIDAKVTEILGDTGDTFSDTTSDKFPCNDLRNISMEVNIGDFDVVDVSSLEEIEQESLESFLGKTIHISEEYSKSDVNQKSECSSENVASKVEKLDTTILTITRTNGDTSFLNLASKSTANNAMKIDAEVAEILEDKKIDCDKTDVSNLEETEQECLESILVKIIDTSESHGKSDVNQKMPECSIDIASAIAEPTEELLNTLKGNEQVENSELMIFLKSQESPLQIPLKEINNNQSVKSILLLDQCQSITPKGNDYVNDYQSSNDEQSITEQENTNPVPNNQNDTQSSFSLLMKSNTTQYQNLRLLISTFKHKIDDIHAFQRKTALKINHGKDGDNSTEHLVQAIQSDSEMMQFRCSQQILSQETVTFSPKIVRQSSLKCSASSHGSQKTLERDENIAKALKEISSDKSLVCDPNYCEWLIPHEITDRRVIQKVSKIISKILDDIARDIFPCLIVPNQRNWSNAVFKNDKLTAVRESAAVKRRINWKRKCSRKTFEFITWILAKIVDLIVTDKTATKREIYYQMRDHFLNVAPHQVDSCVNLISSLLHCAPWDFRIFSTGRGCVYGDLIVTYSNGDRLDCSMEGGVSIPANVGGITKIQTDASFILIIEKNSIFQELVKQDLPYKLGCNCIMITGKGFSDMATRIFIKKIWQVASVPVFILVDCDPYGIEIMLNYRFGSLAQSHLADSFALPQIRWLGVFPSEIVRMNIKTLLLTEHDKDKLEQLLKRPYIGAISSLEHELNTLKSKGVKASIEGIIKGNNFIRDCYIPTKLRTKDFV